MPRFTTRNLMMAVTWFCPWCVALVTYLRFIDESPQPELPVMIAVWLSIVVGPCIAMGALFGNVARGFQVGVAVVGLFMAMLLVTGLMASVSRLCGL